LYIGLAEEGPRKIIRFWSLKYQGGE